MTALLSLCFFAYLITDFGGVRSSDSELVFRVAQSLANEGSFAIKSNLENWQGFGVVEVRQAKYYVIFGPLESVLLTPIVKVAEYINSAHWYEAYGRIIPLSYFIDDGLLLQVKNARAANLEPHALRLLSSVFNLIVSTLIVYVFWLIMLKLTGFERISFIVSVIVGLGSLVWPYSGTFFSEPLATLLTLASFYYLLLASSVPEAALTNDKRKKYLLSGAFLGLACTAHITAVLFIPFFAYYCFRNDFAPDGSFIERALRVGFFSLGVFVFLFLLGIYNYARFENFFETGRSISPIAVDSFGYGEFVWPWKGLFGLLFGAGKGILFFCPAAVLGILVWRRFHREFPRMSLVLLACALFTLLFMASRSDWHGGFCLGPRYLLMVLPFVIIPVALWLKQIYEKNAWKAVVLGSIFGFFFSAQQLYYSIGEVYSFLHLIKWASRARGIDVVEGSVLYLDWSMSPLIYLLKGQRGPFLLRHISLSNYEIWFIGIAVLLLLFLSFTFVLKPEKTLEAAGSIEREPVLQ